MPTATKDACLDTLRTEILTLAIQPGADLDEAALSDRFGLSRTPLREVLQRLAGEGYVTQTRNRGAQVASMDLGQMRTFFQTAPVIYASVARLAAANRTAAQIDELKDVQLHYAQAISAQRPHDMAMGNHRFHELIGEMAMNEYLMPSLRRLQIDHSRISQTFYRPANAAEVLAVREASQQHEAMISAIEAGEAGLMVDLTLQHWDLTRDRIERFVCPDPLPVNIIDIAEKRNAV